MCIRWCSTGAYYTAKLTFSHDFPIKVWGCVLYKCAYYILIFTVYRCGHRGNYLRPQCQYDTINGCGAIYQLQLTPSHWLCGWISRNVDEISWSRTVNGSWITEFPTLWLHSSRILTSQWSSTTTTGIFVGFFHLSEFSMLISVFNLNFFLSGSWICSIK